MKLPNPIRTLLNYCIIVFMGVFTAQATWALADFLSSHPTLHNLLIVDESGSLLSGIQYSLQSGNQILSVLPLGLLGLLLIWKFQPIQGMFRWIWLVGWHEEFWTITLTLYYLRYLSIQWVSPLIFS